MSLTKLSKKDEMSTVIPELNVSHLGSPWGLVTVSMIVVNFITHEQSIGYCSQTLKQRKDG